MSRRLLSFFAVLLFLLSTPAIFLKSVSAGPVQNSFEVVLDSRTTIGQTFFSLYDGLETVAVYIMPKQSGSGFIKAELLAAPGSNTVLHSYEIPVRQIKKPAYYNFSIPAISRSLFQSYYLRFRIVGDGKVVFVTRQSSAYPEGAMYQAEKPVEAQLDFQLAYQTRLKMIGIARQGLSWLLDWLLSALLFVLPGWGILALVWKGFQKYSFGEKLGVSAGVSVALYPVIYCIDSLVGVPLGRYFILVWTVLAVLLVIYTAVRFWRQGAFHIIKWPVIQPDTVALLFVLGLILLSRFWAVRAVPAPLGSDSIQHGAMTQLILDNGGLFQSWLPYAPYKTFTTHFGFHVLAAVFSWLSGKDALQAILITGQFTNVLAVLGLYPLAMMVTGGKRWAGVGAVTAAGLLSHMPAFYINWGRYPQLIGLLILPAAIWFTGKALSQKNPNIKAAIILAGITLAGMFLSYYRLPFFYAAFILAWLICWGIPKHGLKLRPWITIVIRLACVALLAVVLVLPWVGRILSSRLSNDEIHGSIRDVEQVIKDYQIWKNILFYVPLPVLISAALTIGFSFYRKNYRQLSLALWLVFLFLIVSTALLNIPGANLMQSTAVIISVYIPFGLLSGILLAEAADLLHKLSWKSGSYLLAVLVMILGALSLPKVSRIADPNSFAFLTRPDIKAMEWIRANTLEDARFFVEGQSFKQTSVIGGDGGWWLPILTGRQNSMPPQYALVFEYPYDKFYNDKVVSWVSTLEKTRLDQPAGIKMLCEGKFNYLYIGERQIIDDPKAMDYFFTGKELSSSPDYTLVYQKDHVSIFELNPAACADQPK